MIILITNQLRVVHALLMRELQTRYGQRKLGFLWQILEALVGVAVFAMIKHFLSCQAPQGLNIILFLTTGMIPYLYFTSITSRFFSAFEANKSLLVIPNIHLLDFYYARWLLESITSIIVFVIGFAIALAFVKNSDSYYLADYQVNDYMLIIKGFLLIGLLGFGYAILATVIVSLFEGVKLIITAINRVLFFSSGIIFAMEMIPYRYHEILAWNPLVHCISMIREGFFYQYDSLSYFSNSAYVINFSLIMLGFGLLLLFRVKKWLLK